MSLRSSRRKALFGLIGLLVVVVVSLGIGVVAKKKGVLSPPGKSVETAVAREGRFTATVPGSGVIESSRSYEVRSPISGLVERVYVKDGDRVDRGQVLVSFDSSDLKLQLDEARAALAAARADLAELNASAGSNSLARDDPGKDPKVAQARARLEAARARLAELEAGPDDAEVAQAKAALDEAGVTLRDAEVNLSKMRSLFEAGAVSKNAFNEAVTQEKIARARYESARKQYDAIIEGPTESQLIVARSEVKDAEIGLELAINAARSQLERRRALELRIQQAEAACARAERQLADKDVKAAISGVVAGVNAKEGGAVQEGTLLMAILDLDRIIMKAKVDEVDIAKVKVGQAVKVSCDAALSREFAGRVERIAPQATLDGSVPKFTVEISVENGDGILRPGMTADARIVVYDREKVVSIPSQAVVEREATGATGTSQEPGARKSRSVVFVVRDGKAREVEVETGMETPTDTEILSGIKPGDEVVVGSYQALKTLKEGDVVRVEIASTAAGTHEGKKR
ncbi:MAG TPA: efflux RND transporter periplasmic adaptor subunit [Firmicutes bacterium]|nr:efflux RND transporter periplasmic adaptor subunit [Bacillota bacterium]